LAARHRRRRNHHRHRRRRHDPGKGGDDTLLGSYGSDTYLYALGDGNDLIRDTGNTWDFDVLKLTNLNAADITLSRSLTDTNDLLVTVNATARRSRSMTISSWSATAILPGLEQIQFADGTVMSRSQIDAAAWLRGTAAQKPSPAPAATTRSWEKPATTRCSKLWQRYLPLRLRRRQRPHPRYWQQRGRGRPQAHQPEPGGHRAVAVIGRSQ